MRLFAFVDSKWGNPRVKIVADLHQIAHLVGLYFTILFLTVAIK